MVAKAFRRNECFVRYSGMSLLSLFHKALAPVAMPAPFGRGGAPQNRGFTSLFLTFVAEEGWRFWCP